MLSSKDAKKGLHKLYGSRTARKGMCYEDCYDGTGECRGYSGRGREINAQRCQEVFEDESDGRSPEAYLRIFEGR